MWDTIWAILKFVLPILPIVLAALIGIKVNLKKEKRHHQLVLPVVALIYGIVYLLLVDDIALLLLRVSITSSAGLSSWHFWTRSIGHTA